MTAPPASPQPPVDHTIAEMATSEVAAASAAPPAPNAVPVAEPPGSKRSRPSRRTPTAYFTWCKGQLDAALLSRILEAQPWLGRDRAARWELIAQRFVDDLRASGHLKDGGPRPSVRACRSRFEVCLESYTARLPIDPQTASDADRLMAKIAAAMADAKLGTPQPDARTPKRARKDDGDTPTLAFPQASSADADAASNHHAIAAAMAMQMQAMAAAAAAQHQHQVAAAAAAAAATGQQPPPPPPPPGNDAFLLEPFMTPPPPPPLVDESAPLEAQVAALHRRVMIQERQLLVLEQQMAHAAKDALAREAELRRALYDQSLEVRKLSDRLAHLTGSAATADLPVAESHHDGRMPLPGDETPVSEQGTTATVTEAASASAVTPVPPSGDDMTVDV